MGTLLTALLAAALFTPLFVTGGVGRFDFWWWMTANNLVLIALAARIDRGFLSRLAADLKEKAGGKVLLGIGSAAALYGVFFLGNLLSRLILPGSGREIESIYGLKDGVEIWRVALLMVLVFGPGEELFWRAFLQHRLMDHLGRWRGLAAGALLYAAVHLGSGNLMLVAAALVCGLAWGGLYLWRRSPLLNAVSHTLWDLTVFLVLPYA